MSTSHAPLNHEWSVLLAACSRTSHEGQVARLNALLAIPVSWRSLFDLAERHGVLSLLHQALLGTDSVPPEEMQILQQSYQTNLHKTLLLSRELIRIVERLSELGIEVIPYKGPALAEAVYGDIALRKSGDLDLLIHSRDLPRVRNAVRELGYIPHLDLSAPEERAYLKSGYEYAFDGPGGPNLLEVQWAIQPRFYSVDFNVDQLFHRAISVSVAGRPMKSLSYEDLFLVLAVHAAKHLWGRLIWLCDLARLMAKSNLSWDWIGSQARELGIVRILRVTMMLADRLLGAEITSAAQSAIPIDPQAASLADEIRGHLTSETTDATESLAYFRLTMRLRERRSDRWRFLQRLALTPGPGEWDAVRLPAPFFPLYRVVRLARLSKRLLRA